MGIRVIIRGNWAPYVGTDYCEALGIYDSLDAAQEDATDIAWSKWEGPEEANDDWEDEGPDYYVEEYNPEIHDMHKAGGGSFEYDFKRMKA